MNIGGTACAPMPATPEPLSIAEAATLNISVLCHGQLWPPQANCAGPAAFG
jgi:hypothetical protein